MEKFKFLEHTADVKFQAFGKTLEEVFENSVLAISRTITPAKVKSEKVKKISVEANNNETLLCNLIDEVLYLFETENFIPAKAKVDIKDGQLSATLHGDDAKNYKDLSHVKAATYAEMYVKKTAAGWEAQAVVDV